MFHEILSFLQSGWFIVLEQDGESGRMVMRNLALTFSWTLESIMIQYFYSCMWCSTLTGCHLLNWPINPRCDNMRWFFTHLSKALCEMYIRDEVVFALYLQKRRVSVIQQQQRDVWIERIHLYHPWSPWMIHKDRVFWCWLTYCFMDVLWKIGQCFSNDPSGNDRSFSSSKPNNLFTCSPANGSCLPTRRSVTSFVFKPLPWHPKDSKTRTVSWAPWVWLSWWGRWLPIWSNPSPTLGRWVRDWVGD